MNQIFVKILILLLTLPCLGFAEQKPSFSISDDRIECYCHPEDKTVAQHAVDILLIALPEIAVKSGLDQKAQIILIIASSEAEFSRLTQNQIPDWGVGAADPVHSIIFLKSPRISESRHQFSTILLHELSHVLLGQHTRHTQISRWFDEGMAMMVAKEGRIWDQLRVARATQSGQLVYLQHVDRVLRFQKSKAALAYQESKLAVEMMETLMGDSVYKTLIERLNEGHGWKESFEMTMGMPLGAFEGLFLEHIKHRYRWYFIFDFPVNFSIILVVLFILAYFAKRRQARKQIESWEQSLDYE